MQIIHSVRYRTNRKPKKPPQAAAAWGGIGPDGARRSDAAQHPLPQRDLVVLHNSASFIDGIMGAAWGRQVVSQPAVQDQQTAQLHQVAETEIDQVQGPDPVEGEGGLAVQQEGRRQQQKEQRTVGGVRKGPRPQLDGLPALVPFVLRLLDGLEDIQPQGGSQGAEEKDQKQGLFMHGRGPPCVQRLGRWIRRRPPRS